MRRGPWVSNPRTCKLRVQKVLSIPCRHACSQWPTIASAGARPELIYRALAKLLGSASAYNVRPIGGDLWTVVASFVSDPWSDATVGAVVNPAGIHGNFPIVVVPNGISNRGSHYSIATRTSCCRPDEGVTTLPYAGHSVGPVLAEGGVCRLWRFAVCAVMWVPSVDDGVWLNPIALGFAPVLVQCPGGRKSYLTFVKFE